MHSTTLEVPSRPARSHPVHRSHVPSTPARAWARFLAVDVRKKLRFCGQGIHIQVVTSLTLTVSVYQCQKPCQQHLNSLSSTLPLARLICLVNRHEIQKTHLRSCGKTIRVGRQQEAQKGAEEAGEQRPKGDVDVALRNKTREGKGPCGPCAKRMTTDDNRRHVPWPESPTCPKDTSKTEKITKVTTDFSHFDIKDRIKITMIAMILSYPHANMLDTKRAWKSLEGPLSGPECRPRSLKETSKKLQTSSPIGREATALLTCDGTWQQSSNE